MAEVSDLEQISDLPGGVAACAGGQAKGCSQLIRPHMRCVRLVEQEVDLPQGVNVATSPGGGPPTGQRRGAFTRQSSRHLSRQVGIVRCQVLFADVVGKLCNLAVFFLHSCRNMAGVFDWYCGLLRRE